MPIPTRSASLREPRKQISNIARPTTKPSPTAGPKEPARVSNDKNRPTNPSPAEGALKDNGPTVRGRIPLPQRGNTQDNVRAGQVRFQPPGSKPIMRDPSPTRRDISPGKKQAQVDSTAKPVVAPARRQSIMRTNALKIPPSKTTATMKNSAPSFAPPSPRKLPPGRSPVQPPVTRGPPSPKKVEMPPPPRPTRSASLRQPISAPKVLPVAARGHTRHRSQITQTTKPVEATPASQRSRTNSTYQRPPSPKKFSKPPTPTPGAAPQPDNLLIPSSWPDIAALQTELLQLSLFHSNALQEQANWRFDSESRLRKKYDGVAAQYQSLLADETQRQYEINIHALGLWLSNCREHRGPHDFPEQIQLLSQILQEITDTTSRDGKYTYAVSTFESWLGQVEFIHQNRETGCLDIAFVDPLPASWKDLVHALTVKLELCSRQLLALDILGFGQVERLDQSALARVARNLADLVLLMVQEIRAMRVIEAEVVKVEREAVGSLASRLVASRGESRAPRVGAWR